jgi:hypothetical protein
VNKKMAPQFLVLTFLLMLSAWGLLLIFARFGLTTTHFDSGGVHVREKNHSTAFIIAAMTLPDSSEEGSPVARVKSPKPSAPEATTPLSQ